MLIVIIIYHFVVVQIKKKIFHHCLVLERKWNIRHAITCKRIQKIERNSKLNLRRSFKVDCGILSNFWWGFTGLSSLDIVYHRLRSHIHTPQRLNNLIIEFGTSATWVCLLKVWITKVKLYWIGLNILRGVERGIYTYKMSKIICHLWWNGKYLYALLIKRQRKKVLSLRSFQPAVTWTKLNQMGPVRWVLDRECYVLKHIKHFIKDVNNFWHPVITGCVCRAGHHQSESVHIQYLFSHPALLSRPVGREI